MPKSKSKEEVKVEVVKPADYKGYNIRQLRQDPDHPDYYLVKEYDEMVSKEVRK